MRIENKPPLTILGRSLAVYMSPFLPEQLFTAHSLEAFSDVAPCLGSTVPNLHTPDVLEHLAFTHVSTTVQPLVAWAVLQGEG